MTTNLSTANSIPFVLPLWPDGAPGTEDWSHTEMEEKEFPPFGIGIVRNISQPTLIAYLPDPAIATGTAVIIAPGGGFHFLAIDHEGHDVARWLNRQGIAAFILKYRVWPTAADPTTFSDELRARFAAGGQAMRAVTQQIAPLAVADAKQAMKLVRQQAAEWGIATDQVGIMGFSAGGRVTAGLAIEYDAETRPNFAAPIYGALWDEIQVPADAPPLFIALTSDDTLALQHCLDLYSVWQKAGHSAELHIYAEGGHGFGMRVQGLPVDHWIERFHEWLERQIRKSN